ncbi:cupredoxin domain-containing protein [Bacillus sp. ISL-40]|uniref:cupredoxin domain-containing protein n=1 Tax=unclassified Bacillus (in: firmicutes) TaxID=185979 RepID=UPI001BED32D2|nr:MULTISPECIES: cupredoxin domain-containing protein [unclassified Bacillus (in: firmicutes)]MBT2701391.1 cupredoxin domain-containing protein [Bacillus sp. ISL-40]MBT2743644.1 cupredoxin domain-containing protein [Bacillus sp. ISL-77]
MLPIISIILIVLLSSYVVYFTFRNKNKLTCMAGMMISMTNSMMASIAIGSILGTLIQNKDLTIPTIASVTLGMIVGYITGKPVSLMASIDGLTAGIMGGMMGSMLGVMLQPKSTDVMIYFIDIVFVAVMVLLIRLIDEESKTSKQDSSNRKPILTNPIFLVVLLIFMGVLVFGRGAFYASGSEQASNEVEEIKFTDTSSQIYEVMVKPTEYTPNNTVIKAGTPSIINFKTEDVGCTGIVLSEELGFNVSLKAHTNNYVNIKSLKPGTYHYACGMNMYKGTITVQ